MPPSARWLSGLLASSASTALAADLDADGLDDPEEVLLGTSPSEVDTDGDGMTDLEELAVHGSDPLAADPDPDGDGLADPAEATFGTDPADPDTDGDALDDRDEVDRGTDPLDPDSDGDTVPDGGEVLVLGTDPLHNESRCQRDSWPPTTLDPGDEFRSTQVVDLDAHGDPDVLAAAAVAPGLRWYTNAGDGSFAARSALLRASPPANAARAADLDGDGDLDLVAVEGPSAAVEEVVWYANLGGFRFGARHVLASHARTQDPADGLDTADLDGDGDDEVVVASYSWNLWGSGSWLYAYDNRGGGAFGPRLDFSGSAYGAAVQLASGDLDADGDQDVVAGSAWFENRGAFDARWMSKSVGPRPKSLSPSMVQSGLAPNPVGSPR